MSDDLIEKLEARTARLQAELDELGWQDTGREICRGCEMPVGAIKLVVHGKDRRVWHIKCYKAVQRVLAMEEIEREKGE